MAGSSVKGCDVPLTSAFLVSRDHWDGSLISVQEGKKRGTDHGEDLKDTQCPRY